MRRQTKTRLRLAISPRSLRSTDPVPIVIILPLNLGLIVDTWTSVNRLAKRLKKEKEKDASLEASERVIDTRRSRLEWSQLRGGKEAMSS